MCSCLSGGFCESHLCLWPPVYVCAVGLQVSLLAYMSNYACGHMCEFLCVCPVGVHVCGCKHVCMPNYLQCCVHAFWELCTWVTVCLCVCVSVYVEEYYVCTCVCL